MKIKPQDLFFLIFIICCSCSENISPIKEDIESNTKFPFSEEEIAQARAQELAAYNKQWSYDSTRLDAYKKRYKLLDTCTALIEKIKFPYHLNGVKVEDSLSRKRCNPDGTFSAFVISHLGRKILFDDKNYMVATYNDRVRLLYDKKENQIVLVEKDNYLSSWREQTITEIVFLDTNMHYQYAFSLQPRTLQADGEIFLNKSVTGYAVYEYLNDSVISWRAVEMNDPVPLFDDYSYESLLKILYDFREQNYTLTDRYGETPIPKEAYLRY